MNGHFNKRGRNNHQRRRQGVNPNRALDLNGPDVRIRGTAQQIYDKYLALARDATSGGDRVKAENYFQHAEHYFRVLRSAQGPQTSQSLDPSQDGDFDGDQPALGDQSRDQRDFRDQRPLQPQYEGDELASEQSTEDQPSEPAGAHSGADRGPESRNQDAKGQNGDPEGRRRRRRPRRPREDGAPAGADDDLPEPVGAS